MIKRACVTVLLSMGLFSTPFAQDRVNVDDLKMRAAQGDKTATRALADAYYAGRGGVEQDFGEAARWYRRLAAAGDARAQTSLGLMYARGLGAPPNMAEARRWWSLAAAQNDAGAQHNLAMVYFEGQGVEKDLRQALHWFERAARRGHVLSQRMVGLMYYEGNGIDRDELKGLTWLSIAMQMGEEGAEEAIKVLAKRANAEILAQARKDAAAWIKSFKP
jgi:TPR repeat protein